MASIKPQEKSPCYFFASVCGRYKSEKKSPICFEQRMAGKIEERSRLSFWPACGPYKPEENPRDSFWPARGPYKPEENPRDSLCQCVWLA